jgi:hypothetical protein
MNGDQAVSSPLFFSRINFTPTGRRISITANNRLCNEVP